MLDTGQHYACPQQNVQEPSHCATLPVDAGRLDRMVLQFLVNTLVTPDVLDLQTELLAEDAARESQRQQQALEESQSAIAGLDQHTENLLNQVEHGGKTYQQVDAQVTETGRARTELEARDLHSQGQLERAVLPGRPGLGESQRPGPETYLHPDMLEGSRLFFHSFIDAVLIGPESTVIRYTITPTSTGLRPDPTSTRSNWPSCNVLRTRGGVVTGTGDPGPGPRHPRASMPRLAPGSMQDGNPIEHISQITQGAIHAALSLPHIPVS